MTQRCQFPIEGVLCAQMTNEHPLDEQLQSYILGKLPSDAHVAVESHLDQCPRCEELVSKYSDSDSLVDAIALPQNTLASMTTAALSFSRSDSRQESDNLLDSSGGYRSAAHPSIPDSLRNHKRYETIKPLGFGGMGVVWLARHRDMDRLVALKIIRPDFFRHPEASMRFRREIQSVSKLHHPNVVTAYDAELNGDVQFFVSEYVDGQTLLQLSQTQQLSVDEVVRAAIDVCSGLAYAHRHGIIHRDIKPSNLMRTMDGTTKILDFGLAATTGDEEEEVNEAIVGTADYISPEQIAKEQSLSPTSDLYSLGCTLYHLLSGYPPFYTAKRIDEKLQRHQSNQAANIDAISPALMQIVAKLIEKRPENRFRSADEVRYALEQWQAESVRQFALLSHRPMWRIGPSRRNFAIGAALSLSSGLGIWKVASSGGAGVSSIASSKHSSVPDQTSRSFKRTALLRPTHIGSGDASCFTIDQDVVRIISNESSRNVWLDYRDCFGQGLIVDLEFRFLTTDDDSEFKIALNADYKPEYNVQFRYFAGRVSAYVIKVFGESKHVIDTIDLPRSFGEQWCPLAVEFTEQRMLLHLNGRVLSQWDIEEPGSRYPAIASANARVEFRNAFATITKA